MAVVGQRYFYLVDVPHFALQQLDLLPVAADLLLLPRARVAQLPHARLDAAVLVGARGRVQPLLQDVQDGGVQVRDLKNEKC